jgi:hypothetical protein
MNPNTRSVSAAISDTANKIWHLYYDGFRSMTVGRTLWLIIIVKVVIFFGIMKLLFFPDLLKTNFDNDSQRADHVRNELLKKR